MKNINEADIKLKEMVKKLNEKYENLPMKKRVGKISIEMSLFEKTVLEFLELRTCNGCKQIHPLNKFSVKESKHGRHYSKTCQKCYKAREVLTQEKKEEILKRMNQPYYLDNAIERIAHCIIRRVFL